MPRYFGTVRSRVALSHVVLVSLTMVGFIVVASSLFWWHLTRQLYHSAIQNVETAEGLLSFDSHGTLTLREDYHNHPESRFVQDRMVEIRDYNTGQLLYRNDRLGDRSLGDAPFPGEGTNYSPRSARLADGTRVLMVSHVHNLGDRSLLIRQAYEIAPLVARLQEFLVVLGLTFPLTLLIAAWAGFRSASRALQPLDHMIEMAEHITPKRLDERLKVANSEDELGRLAIVINQLLQRLQSAFEQLQRFTSDVSHELRTPLAALRSVGEVGLQRSSTPAQLHDTIGSMLEEAARLDRLVDNLLLISRMDAGQVSLNARPCDVSASLAQCVSLLEILAQEKSQSLALDNSGGSATVLADELLLRQAFLNIIHNAIKYSPEGSWIHVRVSTASDDAIEIHVRDNGPGIPTSHRARLFERFSRSSLDQSGAGLGLAISKWIVEANGGTIQLLDSPATGCHFLLRLPALHQKQNRFANSAART
ncbi:MAG TPA: ATP-binding protein [Fimbriimonadaceae bacterium]|nr:ATP-binding protein [Fimbriimonadaceae bacterium]